MNIKYTKNGQPYIIDKKTGRAKFIKKSNTAKKRRKKKGGKIDMDKVASKVPKAMVQAGQIGLASGAVVSFLAPELGVPLAAVSGASIGIGKAFGGNIPQRRFIKEKHQQRKM